MTRYPACGAARDRANHPPETPRRLSAFRVPARKGLPRRRCPPPRSEGLPGPRPRLHECLFSRPAGMFRSHVVILSRAVRGTVPAGSLCRPGRHSSEQGCGARRIGAVSALGGRPMGRGQLRTPITMLGHQACRSELQETIAVRAALTSLITSTISTITVIVTPQSSALAMLISFLS